MFYPGVYALFPIQESAICICSFFTMQNNDSVHWIMKLGQSSFSELTLANSISFYFINWFALTTLIYLVYRIRHASDDTHLKRECMVIVGIWVLNSFV